MPLVFGRKAADGDLNLQQKFLLQAFLRDHAKLERRVGETLLYSIHSER